MGNTTYARADQGPEQPRAARWISKGFESLLLELGERRTAPADTQDFDVVIVGSGYGGALSALDLAGKHDANKDTPLRVCVLERGREYLAGMFPTSEADLPGHIRFNTPEATEARGRLDALLDLRISNDVTALVANGLGGGSLINAGVMLQPTAHVLRSKSWPQELRDQPDALTRYYSKAEHLLSANSKHFLDFGTSPPPAPLKFRALKELGGSDFQPVPLSIAIQASTNGAGVRLEECKRCGDCATGCNHRAKNSLDQNCLALAQRRGVQLFTGAQVLSVERRASQPGWVLHVVHTDPNLKEQQGAPFPLTARRVILAAGTFGSTEILLRSRSDTLRFSPRLGARFSGNGDLLAAAYGQNKRVNAVALETTPFDQREVGPSVTAMIDRRATSDLVIQEFAIPGAMRRLFSETFTTAHLFHSLGERDRGSHNGAANGVDPCGVDPKVIDNTQILGLIGDDGAAGTLELVPGSDAGQGAIRVRWPTLREGAEASVFSEQVKVVEELVAESTQGGTVLPNPIWRLLPDHLQSFVDIPRGPALTVHPLGGCAMADGWSDGVVDHIGRVFDLSAPGGKHDDLIVLDGSVIPCALGINPSLTISAVTLRALEHLGELWSIRPKANDATRRNDTPPVFRTPRLATDEPAKIAILERLGGDIDLRLGSDREPTKYHVELTLEFEPAQLRSLATDMNRRLIVDATKSRIRLFRPDRFDELNRTGAPEGRYDECAEFIAPLAGHLDLLQRKPSRWFIRTAGAVVAWLLNRGLRDLWQRHVSDRAEHKRRKREKAARLSRTEPGRATFRTALRVANHAGTVRLFDYELMILAPTPSQSPAAQPLTEFEHASNFVGKKFRGRKELAYRIGSNPWEQLSEVALRGFPRAAGLAAPRLDLDARFYATQGLHLMRLCNQRDHATGLFEILSFLLTIARALVNTHFWSFRKPDRPDARVPKRLPEAIPGLPPPSITELPVAMTDEGEAVRIRLTRYTRDKGSGKPVVMIHGFSANGTSYTHRTLKPSLAEYMWRAGRDVWVLDLRTSSGLASCRHPWKFEDVATQDIRVALDYVVGATGQRTDVIGHCMGSAMLSMALLDGKVGTHVRECIDSVVLSQIGPTMVFTPANTFRAYAVRYIEHAIGDVNFEMRPAEGLGSHLLDRMLATVLYPPEDFRLENPRTPWKRTPFVGTRHRMDAWFGCVFKLSNLDREVLDHIDDLFGDINLKTTFQTIHFARNAIVTTRDGHNEFVRRKNLEHWRGIPTLSIHGDLNGLADIATLTRMHMLMSSIDANYHSFTAKGFGHQDCIIGRDAAVKVFPQILQFLDAPATYPPMQQPAVDKPASFAVDLPKLLVRTPWLGPILGPLNPSRVVVGADPKLGQPSIIVLVPVELAAVQSRYQIKHSAVLKVKTPAPVSIHNHRKDMAKAMLDGIAMYEVQVTSDEWQHNEQLLMLLAYDEPPAVGTGLFKMLSVKATATDEQLRLAVSKYLQETLASEVEPVLLERRPKATDSAQVRFAVASCMYPAGPLDPSLASSSYEKLDALMQQPAERPDFLVLAGDQVYTDATAGLMDASKGDDSYQRTYEDLLRTRAVRSVFRRVPVFTILDDHEIRDNWHPRKPDVPIQQAKTAYLKFQRAAGPACTPPTGNSTDPMWYASTIRGLPFFFADTRTERQARTAQRIGHAEIMSSGQFDALREWLSQNAETADGAPLFVVSPSILLPRHLAAIGHPAHALRSDAWDGFPRSLHELLAHIVDEGIDNVVFLSGDEHHSCAATATICKLGEDDEPVAQATIHSIHSSGLYSPYTFANGYIEEFAEHDQFSFNVAGSRYRCTATLQVDSPGDGFAVIDCTPDQGRWALHYSFHKAGMGSAQPQCHELKLAHRRHVPDSTATAPA